MTKRKTVKIGFGELDMEGHDSKMLTKVLHNTLWNMRGKYGQNNVKVIHIAEKRVNEEKGDPKEALSWDYYYESVHVIAYSGNRVIDEQIVFNHTTNDFDGTFMDPMYFHEFDNKKIYVSNFMEKYINEVLKSRLEYFGKYGLKYEFYHRY